jgi:hypothetical protein
MQKFDSIVFAIPKSAKASKNRHPSECTRLLFSGQLTEDSTLDDTTNRDVTPNDR